MVRIHDSPPSFDVAGIAQLARASAFQAEGRGFEPRFPLHTLGAEILKSFFLVAPQVSKLDFVVNVAHIAQWQSTSLVRKRSAVQSRLWAPVFKISHMINEV